MCAQSSACSPVGLMPSLDTPKRWAVVARCYSRGVAHHAIVGIDSSVEKLGSAGIKFVKFLFWFSAVLLATLVGRTYCRSLYICALGAFEKVLNIPSIVWLCTFLVTYSKLWESCRPVSVPGIVWLGSRDRKQTSTCNDTWWCPKVKSTLQRCHRLKLSHDSRLWDDRWLSQALE